jgi:phenylacetate-CoA ligase
MPKRAFHLASQLAAQWASPEVLEKRQLALLQELVQTSYTQTTAWRCLLQRAGVHPDDIRTLQDIERLPVVCKEDLLEFNEDERTNYSVAGANHAERITTSGSSGAPSPTLAQGATPDSLDRKRLGCAIAVGAVPGTENELHE